MSMIVFPIAMISDALMRWVKIYPKNVGWKKGKLKPPKKAVQPPLLSPIFKFFVAKDFCIFLYFDACF